MNVSKHLEAIPAYAGLGGTIARERWASVENSFFPGGGDGGNLDASLMANLFFGSKTRCAEVSQ